MLKLLVILCGIYTVGKSILADQFECVMFIKSVVYVFWQVSSVCILIQQFRCRSLVYTSYVLTTGLT